MSDRTHRRST